MSDARRDERSRLQSSATRNVIDREHVVPLTTGILTTPAVGNHTPPTMMHPMQVNSHASSSAGQRSHADRGRVRKKKRRSSSGVGFECSDEFIKAQHEQAQVRNAQNVSIRGGRYDGYLLATFGRIEDKVPCRHHFLHGSCGFNLCVYHHVGSPCSPAMLAEAASWAMQWDKQQEKQHQVEC